MVAKPICAELSHALHHHLLIYIPFLQARDEAAELRLRLERLESGMQQLSYNDGQQQYSGGTVDEEGAYNGGSYHNGASARPPAPGNSRSLGSHQLSELITSDSGGPASVQDSWSQYGSPPNRVGNRTPRSPRATEFYGARMAREQPAPVQGSGLRNLMPRSAECMCSLHSAQRCPACASTASTASTDAPSPPQAPLRRSQRGARAARPAAPPRPKALHPSARRPTRTWWRGELGARAEMGRRRIARGRSRHG